MTASCMYPKLPGCSAFMRWAHSRMPSSAGPERRQANCEQPGHIEPRGHPRLRDGYGSNDMAARTMLITTTATVEAINTTAFPSPSTISNATVFHGVLLGRLKQRSHIDFFLWAG